MTSEHCFSHASSAVLHRLPQWQVPTLTHVYQASAPSSRRDQQIVRHHPMPPEGDITVAHGIPVTSLARTAWDCAVTMRPVAGLVLLDGALRAGLSRDELVLRAGSATGTRGSARARALIELADPGPESPGESTCRFALLRDGFPAPVTQLEVRTRLGTFWADMGWPEWRLLVEYDGRSKYGSSDADFVLREKRRHDAIVEADWRCIHVTREDLRTAGDLARRLLPHLPEEAAGAIRRRRVLSG